MDQQHQQDKMSNKHHNDNKSRVNLAMQDKPELKQLPPAIRVSLKGQYLIEASAGTGKTWTLTGIVLRLLIEAKRAPEHIIATTFTRAAAAEMRQRIHERLVDFYQVLRWMEQLSADTSNHPKLYPQNFINGIRINKEKRAQKPNPDQKADDNLTPTKSLNSAQKQARLSWLEEQAKLAGHIELVSDPINSHLITYLLDHTEDYPLADAIRRCKLVLTTLDKLFVGTLDSLSQKWLSEYSAETGYQQGVQISADEQLVIESIIHDAVRRFHSHTYYQQPEIYQLLQHTGRLTAPVDHLNVAQKSMQFVSTPIDKVQMDNEINLTTYHSALNDFKNCDLKELEPYFDLDYRTSKGFSKSGKIAKNLSAIITIQQAVFQFGVSFFANLNAQALALFTELPKVFISQDDGGKVFNKGNEAERLLFIDFPSIQLLKAIYDAVQQIERYLEALTENLNREIALKVREKLPAILEARRETTFALQMVRLNQALSGRQGERLARYIRHHYPIALIDESQDINGEQARMIERIYLSKSLSKNMDQQQAPIDKTRVDKTRGFLLLVGDPKQAIYGFRGGDVANYNAMKARFDKQHMMSLSDNRRSNERLVNALNHWFGRTKPNINSDDVSDVIFDNDSNSDSSNDSDSANALAQLGKGIYYQHITAMNKHSQISWQLSPQDGDDQDNDKALDIEITLTTKNHQLLPNQPFSVIHLPYDKQAKYNACELTALHIAALLASEQTLKGRPIQPSDIAVLGRRKHELKQVEDMLSKLGVPTLETAENNVFNTTIATDLAALLEAMLKPNRRDVINRVLTSHFYQLSLEEVQALMASIEQVATSTAPAVTSSTMTAKSELLQRYQDFQNYLKAAANQWQHYGILSALHHLFSHNPLSQTTNASRPQDSNESIWVKLANIENGARHLMDLRHLMDVLAQYGMHIGEHELLAWYKKNMNSKRIPEWAQQQPLPTESGVQLMTIHKSKGLEFPIVYVVGMDGASPKAGSHSQHNLYLYDHQLAQGDEAATSQTNKNVANSVRQLSASKSKHTSNFGDKNAQADAHGQDYYAQFETRENFEELRRLSYVAFTRASEQLYVVLGDAFNKASAEYKPALKWLSCVDHKFGLPERLNRHIGWLNYAVVVEQAEAVISSNKHTTVALKETITDIALRIDYESAYAQLQNNYFRGWAKTSFTALSRQLSEQGKALAIFDDGVEDDLDLSDPVKSLSNIDKRNEQTADMGQNGTGIDNIRFRFVKGANAGTFLHQIFEKIDFINPSHWSTIIDQGIYQYQLPTSYTTMASQQRLQAKQIPTANVEITDILDSSETSIAHNELKDWIANVLAVPLLASGTSLKSINKHQRIAELGFNMGLDANFLPEHINTVFEQHLADDPDKHLQLNSHYTSHVYRYLRGEIDLVYEYAGKYYVVDYKSNYLGNSLSNYNADSLELAMNKAGYWLQAAIYQVALHRFLKLRIADYEGNETSYLGAVEYIFLRGIGAAQSDDSNESYGLITWDIPFALVKALDEMFGKPSR